jgi:hypothetical protein
MFYENNFLLDELAFRHSQKIVEGLKLKEIIKKPTLSLMYVFTLSTLIAATNYSL